MTGRKLDVIVSATNSTGNIIGIVSSKGSLKASASATKRMVINIRDRNKLPVTLIVK